MLFNSWVFIGLFLTTLAVYYSPRCAKFQVHILVVASLIFYAYSQPIMVLLLLASAGINIVSSYYIVFGKIKHKKIFAVSGLSLNLLLLIFFKYSPLISKTFISESTVLGDFLIHIPLPLGISFFTFKEISLVVDVFKNKNFLSREIVSSSIGLHSRNTLFFISFFPQLIAGPITKAYDFIPQIGIKRVNEIAWQECIKHLIIGYFLKMVIADNLSNFTYWMAFPFFQGHSSFTLLTMLFGFSFQIFSDFAGYSLIAIGLAELLGYRLPQNFNFPYIAGTFKDFWKRWHISLSAFLMEYLYFPLGGNRKGRYRTYINLLLTMLLGGIWHGATWSFAIWGLLHGVALVIERFLSSSITVREDSILKILKISFVFIFVSFAWLFFKLPNFEHVIEYVKCIFLNTSQEQSYRIIVYILLYSCPVILYHALYLLRETKWVKKLLEVDFILYGAMLFMVIVNSAPTETFVYFQF